MSLIINGSSRSKLISLPLPPLIIHLSLPPSLPSLPSLPPSPPSLSPSLPPSLPPVPDLPYGPNISPLNVDISNETDGRLHIKIYDPNDQRWEVPKRYIATLVLWWHIIYAVIIPFQLFTSPRPTFQTSHQPTVHLRAIQLI